MVIGGEYGGMCVVAAIIESEYYGSGKECRESGGSNCRRKCVGSCPV